MMVKAIALALVLLSTMGFSARAVRPFRMRVRTLEQWQQLVLHLVPLIEWRLTPLPQALMESARGLGQVEPSVVWLTQEISQREAGFFELWQQMLASDPHLWEEDRAVLAELGRGLGVSDVSFQHDHLMATHHELDRLCADARTQWAKDGRMLGALVGAAGVMVVILML